MDKTSKKVLKFLHLNRDYKKYAFFFNNGTFETFARWLNLSESDLAECLNYLYDNGYIKYFYVQDRVVGFSLEHKGIHFNEFNRIEKMQFIFKSIMVPIFVSVITSLIVNWLQGMQ